MTNAYDDDIQAIEKALEKLLPRMLADVEVSPQAYLAAQQALQQIHLCEEELKTVWWNTICPLCRHKFLLEESPIACPACSYATDNWLDDEEIEDRLTQI